MATTSPARRGQSASSLPAKAESAGAVANTEVAERAHDQIKEALREGQSALWKLAEALWHFDQAQGWAALGHEHLTSWLNGPEIDMTRGTYYRMVRTWQKLAVDRRLSRPQLEAVSMSKAALVADEIAEAARPTVVLKDAAKLPASKLREKYGKAKRGRPAKGLEQGHSDATALKALGELHWAWAKDGIASRSRNSAELRQARLTEFVRELLAWREEFLA